MASFKPDSALKNAPVQFVLCKISCGDLPSFDAIHLANVQEAFRQNDYPHYVHTEISDFEVQHGAGLQVRQHKRTTHHFISNNYSDGIAVSGGDLFVYTRFYGNFENFVNKVIRAHDLFAKTVKIDTVRSVGIRYIDLVKPKIGVALDRYLEQFVLSPSFENISGSVAPISSFSQHSYKTDINSIVVLRATAGKGLKIVPDDLFPMIEPILSKAGELKELGQINEISALIDTDHFITFKALEKVSDMDLPSLIEKMHEYTSSIFFKCVTNHALKEWNS